MKSSNELFLLIKSMNRNEKGYFKKFGTINSKKGDGNYLRLFDCIDGMKEYDERIIKSKFAGEKFLNQLNVTKLYLQKMIIKSLRNYHSDNDPEIQRLNSMAELTLLFKKQLYDSALRMSEKLISVAEENETFLHQLFLMQIQYQIMIRKGMYQDILKTNKAKLAEEKRLLEAYQNLCEYRNIQGLSLSITQIEGHSPNQSVKEIEKLLLNPLLSNEKAPKSFKAGVHRHEILNKCYLKMGQHKKAYETALHMRALFLQNPDKIKQLPYNFFVALNGLTNRCLAMGNYHEALTYVKEAEELGDNPRYALSDSQRFEIYTQINEKRLIIHTKLREFDKGLEAEKLLQEMTKGKPVRVEFEVSTLYFTAVCYFGNDKMEPALKRINQLIHGRYENIRKDIILCAHWLNIMIHYELGNFSLMKRLLTVTKNFMQKHSFPMEEAESFFKKLSEFLKAAEAGKENLLRQKVEQIIPILDNYEFIDDDVMKWWFEKLIEPAEA